MSDPAGSGEREPEQPPRSAGEGRRVLRNAGWLLGAQVLAAPLTLLVNVATARALGPGDFGYIYLAVTLCSFGFLLVDWGQATVLASLIARAPARLGELLGTSIAWRAAVAGVVGLVLAAGCHLLPTEPDQRVAMDLVLAGAAFAAVSRAYLDASRGLERTDLAAYGVAGAPILAAVLVLPAVLLGGKLRAVLGAQVAAAALGLAVVLVAARALRLPRLAVRRAALRDLLGEGTPFLLLGLVLELQGNVDALMLSRLAPAEVLGWQAAATKLVVALTIPANAIITSLYPTLSRLYQESREGYLATARAGLRGGLYLAVPAALGCALYPGLGIWLFDRRSFGAAELNLRILAPFVILLYVNMTLGCALSAAGRQRGWALGQLACVAVSLGLDPLLIPWFQRHHGNGGLGVCLAQTVSELAMLGVALRLIPRGVIDRGLLLALGRAAAAGVAMAGVAFLSTGLGWLLSAFLAVVAYAVTMWVLGGQDREHFRVLGRAIRARLRR